MQVYIWRATSLSKLLQSDERILVSADLTYQNVIDDYCKGHELKPNIAAIVEAILVAVDHTEYQGMLENCMYILTTSYHNMHIECLSTHRNTMHRLNSSTFRCGVTRCHINACSHSSYHSISESAFRSLP